MRIFSVAAFFIPLATAFSASAIDSAPARPTTKDVVNKVAVAGATGRTGRYVVEELLSRGVNVVAMVRDLDKANDVLKDLPNLQIVQCDLTQSDQIKSHVTGCDAAIWCATGFSDAPKDTLWSKIKKRFGVASESQPPQSIDAVGVPALAECFSSEINGDSSRYPKVVMLSSAGVTRPSWSAEQKAMFPGSADIPIVRLNPFGILDIKAESEQKLRQSGVEYCIIRPCGLNDKWPTGSRPIFSQGDIAVGRIHRKDLAILLVDALSTPEAVGKTFEAMTLAGYPPATSIGPALEMFVLDKEGGPSIEQLAATYSAMQQLLPGENQDSSGLALGQTYEQLDKGQEGRFGQKGEERIGEIPMRPSS